MLAVGKNCELLRAETDCLSDSHTEDVNLQHRLVIKMHIKDQPQADGAKV
jgi:hypothetical protein